MWVSLTAAYGSVPPAPSEEPANDADRGSELIAVARAILSSSTPSGTEKLQKVP